MSQTRLYPVQDTSFFFQSVARNGTSKNIPVLFMAPNFDTVPAMLLLISVQVLREQP